MLVFILFTISLTVCFFLHFFSLFLCFHELLTIFAFPSSQRNFYIFIYMFYIPFPFLHFVLCLLEFFLYWKIILCSFIFHPNSQHKHKLFIFFFIHILFYLIPKLVCLSHKLILIFILVFIDWQLTTWTKKKILPIFSRPYLRHSFPFGTIPEIKHSPLSHYRMISYSQWQHPASPMHRVPNLTWNWVPDHLLRYLWAIYRNSSSPAPIHRLQQIRII